MGFEIYDIEVYLQNHCSYLVYLKKNNFDKKILQFVSQKPSIFK